MTVIPPIPDRGALLRLADAAEAFGFKLATLRTEARRGRLAISEIAGTAPAAFLACDLQAERGEVGKGDRAVAGHASN